MVLAELRAHVYERLGYSPTPGQHIQDKVTAYLNEAHRVILSRPGVEGVRDTTVSVACVADQQYMAMPGIVSRIQSMQDIAGNDHLTVMDKRDIRLVNPDQQSGTPESYAILGNKAYHTMPTGVGGVTIVSTDAADTMNVTVTGVAGPGLSTTETVALTGVTPAALTKPWADIWALTTATAPVGDVSLAEGATPVSTVYAGRIAARYYHVLLYPTPSSVITYNVDVRRSILALVADNDEPLIPEEHQWILESGARQREYEKRQERGLAQDAKDEFEDGFDIMLYDLASAGDKQRRGLRGERSSQLGAYFPANS